MRISYRTHPILQDICEGKTSYVDRSANTLQNPAKSVAKKQFLQGLHVLEVERGYTFQDAKLYYLSLPFLRAQEAARKSLIKVLDHNDIFVKGVFIWGEFVVCADLKSRCFTFKEDTATDSGAPVKSGTPGSYLSGLIKLFNKEGVLLFASEINSNDINYVEESYANHFSRNGISSESLLMGEIDRVFIARIFMQYAKVETPSLLKSFIKPLK